MKRSDETCENDWYAIYIRIHDGHVKIRCEKYCDGKIIMKCISIRELRAFNPSVKIKLQHVPLDIIAEIKQIISSQGIFFDEYFCK
jgi:hypothetical protein